MKLEFVVRNAYIAPSQPSPLADRFSGVMQFWVDDCYLSKKAGATEPLTVFCCALMDSETNNWSHIRLS